MHGLPQDFEPHSLEGYALVMIGLGTGTLVLNFSRSLQEQSSAEMRISIGSEFEYVADGVGGTANPANPAEGARLVSFLNRDITKCSVIDEDGLNLYFGSADFIGLRADRSGFESYTIFLEGTLPIVV